MKLNKTFGRIATTLVATAMLASVAVVPAFAADGVVEGSIEEPITLITLTKELLVPTGVTVPDVTYEFSIQNATPGTDDTHDVLIDDKNYEMLALAAARMCLILLILTMMKPLLLITLVLTG